MLRTLLREMGLSYKCHHCSSGAQALDYLHRRPPFQNAVRPHLILLDLNMPGMDGCEVLRQVKSDSQTRSIPVVMLSTSRSREDVAACYTAHANAYMRKPTDLAGNVAMLQHLDQFWKDCELLGG
jgi:CheY-like chemotaxis protein